MTTADARVAARGIAGRYAPAGRFVRHYVAGKLQRDPVWRELCKLGHEENLGDVVDVGCGRGQFAAALLDARLARSVLGIDRQQRHLDQACAAMADLAFSARLQDLSANPTLPAADTVLLIDVIYQLDNDAQLALLRQAAKAARRRIILRTADPARGLRSRVTRLLERAFQPVWPHAGRRVNARPVSEIVDTLETFGLRCDVSPCWAGTPFSNVLVVARKEAVLF